MKTRELTSDGVPKESWDRIHTLAVAYANLSLGKSRQRIERTRQKMLRLLRDLEYRFGERPSLVATRSDYVKPTAYREKLLLRAFGLAKRRRDRPNMVFVSSSLASLYVEDIGNVTEGARWLKELDAALSAYPDALEKRTYRSLLKQLRDMRSH
jgi:hypothetical protein